MRGRGAHTSCFEASSRLAPNGANAAALGLPPCKSRFESLGSWTFRCGPQLHRGCVACENNRLQGSRLATGGWPLAPGGSPSLIAAAGQRGLYSGARSKTTLFGPLLKNRVSRFEALCCRLAARSFKHVDWVFTLVGLATIFQVFRLANRCSRLEPGALQIVGKSAGGSGFEQLLACGQMTHASAARGFLLVDQARSSKLFAYEWRLEARFSWIEASFFQ